MRGETILILANAEWDWETRVNCHHLAARLARENRVLFVDTVGGRTPAPREFRKVARRLRRIAGGVRQVQPGLTVLSPFVLPVYGNDRIRELNTVLLAWQIRRAMPGLRRPILWLFLPSLVGLAGKLGEKLVVYHCIDRHAANPNVPAAQVNAWEAKLAAKANVVLASSNTLYATMRAANRHTYYVPNVADADHFARARDAALVIPEDLQGIPRPIAGFVGNITAYKLDLDLLAQIARAKPDWSLVLIGPVGRGDPSTDVSSLAALPNVHILGPRPYADLPRYVKGFDVCLIPFKQSESTQGTLPMKFFEYLAAGKPVIATELPTLGEFRELYYPACNLDEWVAALERARAESETGVAARVRAAQHYSWDTRMTEIDAIVSGALVRIGGKG